MNILNYGLQKRPTIEWFDPDVFSEDVYNLIHKLRLDGYIILCHDTVSSEDIERLKRKTVDLIIAEMLISAPYRRLDLPIDGDCTNYEAGILFFLQEVLQEDSANMDTQMLIYTKSPAYSPRVSALDSIIERNYGVEALYQDALEPLVHFLLPKKVA